MSIDYSIHFDGEILRITARGKDDSLEDVNAYGDAIIAAGKKYKSRKVLCDETALTYTLGTLDTFQSAVYIAEQVPSMAILALVTKESQIKDAKFWETVANNRGLNVRVFRDTGEAEKWLATFD